MPTPTPQHTSIEIRAGEGGDDAHRFAAELAATLTAHLARHGHQAHTTTGATRTLTLTTTAPPALLTWLTGTHRVQRIPAGATRRHTSTATIAVLTGAQSETEHELGGLGEVRVDRYRGSGPGGQHRNKVSSSIRLTHHASGIVVVRESGRSQAANLADAQRDLAERLRARATTAAHRQQNRERRGQVTAERAAKVFTHSQQRSEVVDHATGRRWTAKAWTKGDLD